MKDHEFDEMLMELMTRDEMVSEKECRATPTHRAMLLILIGLTMIFFQCYGSLLMFVFPTIGYLLLLFGFYILHQDNRYFSLAFMISLISLGTHTLSLLLLATPDHQGMLASPLLTAISIQLQLGLIYCYTKGLSHAFHYRGKQTVYALLSFLLMVLIMLYGSFYDKDQPVLLLCSVLLYLFMIYQLVRIHQDIKQQGYLIQTSRIRVSLIAMTAAYLILLLLSCSALLYHFTHQDLPAYATRELTLTNERQVLVDKGMQKELADALQAEDVITLSDISSVWQDAYSLGKIDSNGLGQVSMTIAYAYTAEHEVQAFLYYQINDHDPSALHRFQFSIQSEDALQVEDRGQTILYDEGNTIKEANVSSLQPFAGNASNHTRGYLHLTLRGINLNDILLDGYCQRQDYWYQYPYTPFPELQKGAAYLNQTPSFKTYHFQTKLFQEGSWPQH